MKKEKIEVLLGLITLLFAISTTLSFFGQSALINYFNAQSEQTSYFQDNQQEQNTLSVLKSLCDLDNSSISCGEYETKATGYGNHFATWESYQNEFSREMEKNYSLYQILDFLSLTFFIFGFLISIIYVFLSIKKV